MSTDVSLAAIKNDLKACYFFPQLIDALPEELFLFQTSQTDKPDPLFVDCSTTLTLTPISMILKVRHSTSGEEIGVYIEQHRVRFRIARGADPKNFTKLTRFFDLESQIRFLIAILRRESESFELAMSA
ncbi:MAG: hypothetical protein AAGF04_02555 [Chlamydiota bacterium]